MRRFLSRYIVLPAFETLWKRRRTFQYLKNLEQTQWLTKEELDQLQFAALRKLLTHTYQHCPYYREAWTEAGVDPRQLQTALGFRKLPLTHREPEGANVTAASGGRGRGRERGTGTCGACRSTKERPARDGRMPSITGCTAAGS